ncbi:hypothetical protein [Variovorax soli]|uniref:Uncharacterized protein n=1 Tax=Variovorax soli TaxID=376815 RepID=A0ABU1NLW3_9BURK|nr:hypothetical protein [Variovorax soli]MDR6539338.1 hypothetical protein [Variovorax soli]
MRAVFFSFGFIWTLASVGSVVLGPFVGLNRLKIKEELKDFYHQTSTVYWKKIPTLFLFFISLIGLIFPIAHPLIGFVVGAVFFCFSLMG